MSVALAIDISDLQFALAHVSRLSLDGADQAQLLENIGELGENQTRRRIEVEKTAPDGTPWQPNLEGHSILLASGRHLRDSVAFHISGADEVEWGEAWEFAHVHQYGATILPKVAQKLAFKVNGRQVFASKVTIPARPSVGLSAQNREELTEHVSDFLARLER